MAKQKRRPSPTQRLRQNAFKYCCNAWSNYNWTDTELASWLLYADRLVRLNKHGHQYYPTPFQAFIKVNIVRSYNGLDLLFNAPLL